MIHMKHYYLLLNYYFSRLTMVLFLGSILMYTTSLLLIRTAVATADAFSIARYDQLFNRAGAPYIFLLTMIGLFIAFFWQLHLQQSEHKSIYTLLTLPVHRTIHYVSGLSALFIAIICLFAVQFLVFYSGYFIVERQQLSMYFRPITPVDTSMYNYFLAYIRSHYIRFLFPFHPATYYFLGSGLLYAASVLYYAVLAAQQISKSMKSLLSITVIVSIQLFMMHLLRILDITESIANKQLLLPATIIFCFSIIWIVSGLHWYKKGGTI